MNLLLGGGCGNCYDSLSDLQRALVFTSYIVLPLALGVVIFKWPKVGMWIVISLCVAGALTILFLVGNLWWVAMT